MSKKELGTGSRSNNGKIRHDLLEPWAINELAKVFTKGQIKYPEPPHNWLRGMKWSVCIESLHRHINAFERGEDFDFDENCSECKQGTCVNHTGLYHMAHAAWNALALLSYYKYYPQGDNRLHNVLPKPRIGLDIDDVICVWVKEWCKKYNLPIPSAWNFQWDLGEQFEKLKGSIDLNEFYLNLPVNEKPEDIPFVPECYITHRPVTKEITEEWLKRNNFPLKPVFQVSKREDKLEVAKQMNLDIFVDDNYDTFEYLNKNGICCFLYDALHNRRHYVGYKRIKSLKELIL